jgi:hypothetical protein
MAVLVVFFLPTSLQVEAPLSTKLETFRSKGLHVIYIFILMS